MKKGDSKISQEKTVGYFFVAGSASDIMGYGKKGNINEWIDLKIKIGKIT